MVRGDWHSKFRLDPVDDVEIGQRGFDHHDVRAFFDIQRHFAQGLVAVRRVHLIGSAVAKLRRGFRRLSEGPVKGRAVFGRVCHNGNAVKPLGVKRRADRPDPSIHHVRRRDHIRARPHMREGFFDEISDGFIVVYLVVDDDTAMPVVRVFAKTHIGDHVEIGHLFFNRGDGALNNAPIAIRLATRRVFAIGNAEENRRGNAQIGDFSARLNRDIDRHLMVARHRSNFSFHAFARAHKQGHDEIVNPQVIFAHHSPHRFTAAHPAHACDWKGHGSSRRSKMDGKWSIADRLGRRFFPCIFRRARRHRPAIAHLNRTRSPTTDH